MREYETISFELLFTTKTTYFLPKKLPIVRILSDEKVKNWERYMDKNTDHSNHIVEYITIYETN